MLLSEHRFFEDFVPSAHAVASPEVHSLLASARDGIVTLAYGRPGVLQAPQWVTTDSRQRVILTDPGVPAVHILDPKGKTSFSILGGQGRRLQLPGGVAVDAEDNIYIADSSHGMVLVYDQYGRFVRYIGNFHGENMYQHPTGIAIDRKAGHLYLADTPRHLVLMLDLQGNLLKPVRKPLAANGEGLTPREDFAPREFNNPTQIALGEHEVVVMDTGGTRIRIMDMECNLLASFSVRNVPYQDIDRQDGLGVDREGNIYVSHVGTSDVGVYNSNGVLLATFGQAGYRMGEFSAPRGLWVDSNNRLYVADTANLRVQLFQLNAH
jgi:sugar lactone lactonase YvrE